MGARTLCEEPLSEGRQRTGAQQSKPSSAADALSSDSGRVESPTTPAATSESSVNSSKNVLADDSSAERETVNHTPGITRMAQGLAEGSVVGDCIIAERIGTGGMGIVFKAGHLKLNKPVAVKILRSAVVEDELAVRRFHQEVRAAMLLSHPNIVAAYEDAEMRGMHYLVMEYIDGETLAEVVARQGPLPVDAAVDYIMQAARGLEYAHAMGVVHRDIKPGNLLLSKDGVVKILDMGLARLDEADEAIREATSFESLTSAHQVMGTLDYMAPEQAADARKG